MKFAAALILATFSGANAESATVYTDTQVKFNRWGANISAFNMGTMLAMSNGVNVGTTGCTAAADSTNAQIATQFDLSQY